MGNFCLIAFPLEMPGRPVGPLMPTRNGSVFNILFQIKESDWIFLSAGGFSKNNRIQGRLGNDIPSPKLANVSCCSLCFDPTVVNLNNDIKKSHHSRNEQVTNERNFHNRSKIAITWLINALNWNWWNKIARNSSEIGFFKPLKIEKTSTLTKVMTLNLRRLF